MRFNLAILTVLAARPEQRIPVEEVSREVKRMIAAGDAATQLDRSAEQLGNADVFQSGWASINPAGLQITDTGLSLLRSLEAAGIERQRDERRSGPLDIAATSTRRAAIVEQPETIDLELPPITDHDHGNRVTSHAGPSPPAPDPPARDAPIVLPPAFGSVQPDHRNESRLSALAGLFGKVMPGTARARRRRAIADIPDRNVEGRAGKTGLALAFLSALSIIACVGAAIAFGQISSLKADLAALRREQAPLRERLAKLEQSEAARREAAQQEEAQQAKAEAERKASESGGEQAMLGLSRDEIQLIREYIKAAPSAGAAAVTTKVGDPVTGGMIPLPSSLTEKVPRLVGARFATRNGAIIISTRNSRRVDAVLLPN
ncbi:hypothetical protein XH93_24075 [Bradyrhizobium sp. CCBAU 51753]|nr:hypothetical protein XH93_24075 [Bradyrhizobium sp. CCBAU 51753]